MSPNNHLKAVSTYGHTGGQGISARAGGQGDTVQSIAASKPARGRAAPRTREVRSGAQVPKRGPPSLSSPPLEASHSHTSRTLLPSVISRPLSPLPCPREQNSIASGPPDSTLDHPRLGSAQPSSFLRGKTAMQRIRAQPSPHQVGNMPASEKGAQ